LHNLPQRIHNQGDEGVACGGPCTDAVTTCFGGIQNQDEEGINCAGPCAEDGTGYCGDVIIDPGAKNAMSATTTPVASVTTIFRT
jgi:hypothetical protein